MSLMGRPQWYEQLRYPYTATPTDVKTRRPESDMHEVFVSYAKADAEQALRIVEFLEAEGVRSWIAPRDIPPGVDYAQAIITAIEQSRALIVVLSEAANESTFVRREVERAVSKSKPLLPVRIREVTPSGALELFLSSAQWVDAWEAPIERHLSPLVVALKPGATPAVHAPSGAQRMNRVQQPFAPRARHLGIAGIFTGLALATLGLWWHASDGQNDERRNNVTEPAATPARNGVAATEKSTPAPSVSGIDIAGEWSVEYVALNTMHRGTLRVFDDPSGGLYRGTMELRWSNAITGEAKRVRQTASIRLADNEVIMNFSDPAMLEGRGTYQPDDFYLQPVSPSMLRGHARDRQGMIGSIVMVRK